MVKQGNGGERNLVGAGIAIALLLVSFIVLPKIVTREEGRMRQKGWRIKRL